VAEVAEGIEDEIRDVALDAIAYRVHVHGQPIEQAASEVEAMLRDQGIPVDIVPKG
jgi:hypothetical protein